MAGFVSRTTAERWEDLALLADKIAQGKSRDFPELRRIGILLDGSPVMGVLNMENPCLKLRRLCAKAGFSATPSDYYVGMIAQAKAVRALKAEVYPDA